MSSREQQKKEIEEIKERKITVKLSPTGKKMWGAWVDYRRID